jgi:hypothetical protein
MVNDAETKHVDIAPAAKLMAEIDAVIAATPYVMPDIGHIFPALKHVDVQYNELVKAVFWAANVSAHGGQMPFEIRTLDTRKGNADIEHLVMNCLPKDADCLTIANESRRFLLFIAALKDGKLNGVVARPPALTR